MSTVWVAIVATAAASLILKAAGPVLVGGRELPPRALAVIALLAPALLSALIVAGTFSEDGAVVLDAKAAGLAAAGAALAVRAPMLVALLTAAAVTAAVRALG